MVMATNVVRLKAIAASPAIRFGSDIGSPSSGVVLVEDRWNVGPLSVVRRPAGRRTGLTAGSTRHTPERGRRGKLAAVPSGGESAGMGIGCRDRGGDALHRSARSLARRVCHPPSGTTLGPGRGLWHRRRLVAVP